MTSYQHDSLSTTSLEQSQSKRRPWAFFYTARRIVGLTFLTGGIVCVLMATFSSMRHAFPYAHMEMIPIELEGWSSRQTDGETDHMALKDGCEATVIRKSVLSELTFSYEVCRVISHCPSNSPTLVAIYHHMQSCVIVKRAI